MANNTEEMKKSIDVWTNWFKKQGNSVIDHGNPTAIGKTVTKRSIRAITGNIITGYSIFQAENLDEAITIAKSSPQLDGGRIAIYIIMPTM